MMRSALKCPKQLWSGFILSAVLAWIALTTDGLGMPRDEDSVQVSSVRIYSAQKIDKHETAGQFWHVHAVVSMTKATRSQLNRKVDVPTLLSAQLVVAGKTYLRCGTGSDLPYLIWNIPSESPSAGEPIANLFYLPEEALSNDQTAELVVGLRSGNWEQYKPVARAVVPWPRVHTPEMKTTPPELVHIAAEDQPHNKSQRSQRSMQVIRLRLSHGLNRAFGGGASKLYCGSNLAERLNVGLLGDTVSSWFASSIDVSSCSWEIRFPDLGVKLELGLAKAPPGK